MKGKKKGRWKAFVTAAIWIVGLILAYLLIYRFFQNQKPVPEDSILDNSDWLGFLSGYLSFAGALIMAWLVYKQNERINQLTLQEYRVILAATLDEVGVTNKTDYDENTNNIISKKNVFYYEKNSTGQKKYLKFDVGTSDNDGIVYIVFRIENKGKIRIENLKVVQASLFDMKTGKERTTFIASNSTDGGNIFEGEFGVSPGGTLYLCVVIHEFPKEMKSTMKLKINIRYRLNEIDNISKDGIGDDIVFYVSDENNAYNFSDGENVKSAQKAG